MFPLVHVDLYSCFYVSIRLSFIYMSIYIVYIYIYVYLFICISVPVSIRIFVSIYVYMLQQKPESWNIIILVRVERIQHYC